ncbi:MAG TPA: MerR family transcriptional regulator [Herpetosiphonaceae bacterium]|nr:MerR family transcriptional regulator [Herpetosiphonaceae bacterium]
MNESRQGLLAIGSFAKATQLSIKALRLYDQLGLLKPSHIDPDSGYRYYGNDQLHRARLIRMLRQMELPLAEIRRVLGEPDEAWATLQAHVRALEDLAAQARRMIRDVMSHIHEEEPTMANEVQVREVPARPIISITQRVKVQQLGDTIGAGIAALVAIAEAQGGEVAGAPFGIYHGPINADEDGPIEICLPTATLLADQGEVSAATLPPMRAAVATLRGEQCEFPRVLEGYDQTYDWIRRHGYRHAGSPHEVWVSPPGADEHMEVLWAFEE